MNAKETHEFLNHGFQVVPIGFRPLMLRTGEVAKRLAELLKNPAELKSKAGPKTRWQETKRIE